MKFLDALRADGEMEADFKALLAKLRMRHVDGCTRGADWETVRYHQGNVAALDLLARFVDTQLRKDEVKEAANAGRKTRDERD